MPGSHDGLLPTLDRANARRAELYEERARIITEIMVGRMPILDALYEPAMKRMRAFTFLTKMPRIGQKTARDILREVNVGEAQRISTTGARQRERMAQLATEARPRGRR